MSDQYSSFANSPFGARFADLLGLPKPAILRRYEVGGAPLPGPAVVGGDGALSSTITDVLAGYNVTTLSVPDTDGEVTTERYGALVFDASGFTSSADLVGLHEFFHATIRRMASSARIVVTGLVPETCTDPAVRTAQRALEGFVRSIAKELRSGGTANLILVHPGAEAGIGAALRFLLSGRSAFVSGQVITVGPASDYPVVLPEDLAKPHAGKTVVVTGAARGIGAAIARVFARDGGDVVGIDLPSAGEDLANVMNEIGGTAVQMDLSSKHAPEQLIAQLTGRHEGAEVVVHNAGVTRDKTMAGMDTARWEMVMAVNLMSIERINNALLNDDDALGADPRIVCVSSMAGIAGNRGQTNYAASKAGVIGHVESLAPALAERGGTINAVAPGFIETKMTAAIPMGTREAGRRLSSLAQGGLPVDVAETIGFFAGTDAGWINGTTLRVCGQSIMGA